MIVMNNRRGDTLIEVTVALAILGALIVVTYGLATRLFNLGRSASERTQISNLMQNQAELFRSARDNSNWLNFQTAIAPCLPSASNCQVAVSTSTGLVTVSSGTLTSGLFTITTTAAYAASSPTGIATDKVIFHMHGSWLDSSGITDQTDLDFFLTNVDTTPVAL